MPRIKTFAKNHPYQTLFFVRTRCVVLFGHHFCCLWMVSTTKTILQHSFDLRPEYHYHCGQGGKLSRPSIQKKQKFIQPRECHTHCDWCTWTISHRMQTPGTGGQISLTPSKVHGCQPSLVMITFYVKCCTSLSCRRLLRHDW